jgi:serine/threonine-protein kinase
MGQVYLARRTFTGGVERTCVVKTTGRTWRPTPPMSRCFREAKILCLLHHQNIVQILDFDRVDGLLYLAWNTSKGRICRLSCTGCRKNASPCLGNDAAHHRRGVARSDYAHRRTDEKGDGWASSHRDLTPNNILISKEGEVKIVDSDWPNPSPPPRNRSPAH